ncbi:hypothetical protein [Geosporobacter ferrireducens]|uniref:Uncharacterized protein n=1 Tax=Geosporobacter ferrireducens TaxID=1424294 RepID=A0A1D8GBT0_9FIRM|nr:hypothetical protein [Geosporobacter ferrireducens]AOT68359.1 hypothetical protein Gferi_01365 [Geosporobacter ferrireducens]
MSPYVNPPPDLNWRPIEGIISVGGAFITIIGGLLIITSVMYVLIGVLTLFIGRGRLFTKENNKWCAIGLCVGLLFLGGGWYTLLKTGQDKLIKNITKIFQMDQATESRPIQENWPSRGSVPY